MNFSNETEMTCYLYKNEEFTKEILSKIINEMFVSKVEKQDISYCGVEFPVYSGNGYKRIDMLYKINDICYIPLELKTQNYVGSALGQVEKYGDLLYEQYRKPSILGVIANHISKPEKERINKQKNAFWIEFETMSYGTGVGD